ILNLQGSPGNFPFFSQWRHLCHASDSFADSLTADPLTSIFEGGQSGLAVQFLSHDIHVHP
ncbi:MAG TPA: hypothetical protein PLD43_13490, partial [Anaerolineae bacterium]|nr:hypothetical protein [Anaerolineae bacterium]